ncbi:MAG: hypothetical protein K0S23_799 [Fluviicola sp.]|jgi:hypothetical protein|uniref:hypothetical protein n=1 Tax=Fluviicola sp. TaxID=1917219 RepID=UPI0026246C34|nr:hypothetical protein [Fluviicola sp.]MDF3026492.1 hypothetical protein [Fluviicola sp.]
MKILLIIPFLIFSCVSFSQTEPEERVWEKIENAPVIDVKNAATFSTYENTLESVVNYFYASQIRKDKEWEKVVPLPEERTERLQSKLKRYEEVWTITTFHLVSKTQTSTNRFMVRVYFEITGPDGRKDGGIDTAEVRLIDGKWVITSIPT